MPKRRKPKEAHNQVRKKRRIQQIQLNNADLLACECQHHKVNMKNTFMEMKCPNGVIVWDKMVQALNSDWRTLQASPRFSSYDINATDLSDPTGQLDALVAAAQD